MKEEDMIYKKMKELQQRTKMKEVEINQSRLEQVIRLQKDFFKKVKLGGQVLYLNILQGGLDN